MDFIGIGPGELIIIIIVALLVFGPARLADISKTVGKTTRSFKQAVSEITTQLNRDILDEAVKSPSPPAAGESGKTPAEANLPDKGEPDGGK